MHRSRITRALIAIGAGIVGAAAVVYATVAFTHAGHHAVHVASLTPLPPVEGAPRAAEAPAGLLPWQAPSSPPPLRLAPVVVGSTRVVETTRYVKAAAAPAPVSSRTTAKAGTTRSRQAAQPRRTSTGVQRDAERRTPSRHSGTHRRPAPDDGSADRHRDRTSSEASRPSHDGADREGDG